MNISKRLGLIAAAALMIDVFITASAIARQDEAAGSPKEPESYTELANSPKPRR
jgi:hypothetical protein